MTPKDEKVSRSAQVMTKPLPQILDEMDAAIAEAQQATLNANQAAKEARAAGEQAGMMAEKRAQAAIDEFRQDYRADIAGINGRLDVIENKMSAAGGALSFNKK